MTVSVCPRHCSLLVYKIPARPKAPAAKQSILDGFAAPKVKPKAAPKAAPKKSVESDESDTEVLKAKSAVKPRAKAKKAESDF